MRKSRFTEAQIIGMIKEQGAGMSTAEVCRRHGLSTATFYKLKAKYGGMAILHPAKETLTLLDGESLWIAAPALEDGETVCSATTNRDMLDRCPVEGALAGL